MMAVAALLLAVPVCTQAPGAGPDVVRAPEYRHAYELLLDDTPAHLVLLTSRPLDQVAGGSEEREAVLIVTYQLDSIFWVKRGVEIPQGDVRAAKRHVRLQPTLRPESHRWYTYQAIDIDQVRRLLEHPEGTIPVHRPGIPREDLDAILAAVKRQN